MVNSEPAAVPMHGELGTLRWQAPELFPDIVYPDSNDIERRTTATDVYSFALVCYEVSPHLYFGSRVHLTLALDVLGPISIP